MLKTGMVVQITGSHTGVLASSALCMYSAHPSSMLLTKKKLFMYLYYGRMCIICFRHVRENKLTGPVDIIQLSKPQLVEFEKRPEAKYFSRVKVYPASCLPWLTRKSLTAFHSICEKSMF